MRIVIQKALRRLTLWDGSRALLCCPVGLGPCPDQPKRREGDGCTPQGSYRICLVKNPGKYGRSLGLSYPGPQDAAAALARGSIDRAAYDAILLAHAQGRRPPWGTPLGGEIYIHEGGSFRDWTQGCIALDPADMDQLFPFWPQVESVEILP